MRKIIVILALSFSIMLVVPCLANSLPPVTNGLVGCWTFDEGSGSTALDSSSNGNNGLIVNATYSTDVPTQSPSTFSLRFNSTHSGNAYSYVTIPDSPSLRPSSGLTLAVWVKTNSSEGRLRDIVSKQYGGGLGDTFVIWYHDDGRLWFASSVGSVNVARPAANEWHYIVGTYDGSYMRLYVDGVELGYSSATGPLLYDDSPVLIGADCNNAYHTADEGWNGNIDEVLIYNKGLSQPEIGALMYSSTLYGLIGNHLVTINQNTGNATEVGVINATGATAMTYDPYKDVLYCLANFTTAPELITIDRNTAKTALVGLINLTGYDPGFLTFVESLAFNPVDRFLYGTAGTYPISSMLLRIDPATGNATQIASITGTTENDGDSLVFINDTLYLVDSPDSVLFTINLNTGAASYVGDIGFNNVKMAYNPETKTLFGAPSLERLLIEISQVTGLGIEIGQTHTPEEFEGTYLHTMTVVFDRHWPDIDVPTQSPVASNVQPYQNVTISVNVTDNLSGVKNVTLVYSLDNTTTWEEPLAMNHNATTGSYEAVIPGQPTGTWVKYKIVAYDQAGNNVTLEGAQSYLAYQVISEFPSLSVLPLFMIVTLMAVFVFKRNRDITDRKKRDKF